MLHLPIDPLDNGPADEDSDPGKVRVGVRDSFVIQLDDFALDHTTVTTETLSITRDAAPFADFTFAFDPAVDQITLTPTVGAFDEGLYSATPKLSARAISIRDGYAERSGASFLSQASSTSIRKTMSGSNSRTASSSSWWFEFLVYTLAIKTRIVGPSPGGRPPK